MESGCFYYVFHISSINFALVVVRCDEAIKMIYNVFCEKGLRISGEGLLPSYIAPRKVDVFYALCVNCKLKTQTTNIPNFP